MSFVIAGNSASTGYNLTRSLRLRSSASAYLSRTPSVAATSNKIFTISFWAKPSLLVPLSYIWFLDCSGQDFGFYYNASYTAAIQQNAGANYITTSQVFRDPAAWYHFVLAVDTTQATAANRIKLYVNGSQVTAFSGAAYPPQNTTFLWNQNGQIQYIGRNSANASILYDGYFAEFYSIDGQQLTPSSFGSTNTLTGVWQPARYTGTYGTNGFYLPFTDNSALTTASNVGLGKDFSGNANYWVTNNISITAGVTYDSMTDVPTLTSATAANFAVLNPLNNSGGTTISDGNLKALWASVSDRSVLSTFPTPSSGKFYAEFVVGTLTSANVAASFGLATEGSSRTGMVAANMWVYYASSQSFIVRSGTFSSQIGSNQTLAAGGILQVAIDRNNNQAWLGYNNVWINSTNGTTGDPSAGTNPTVTSLPADLFILVGMYANNGNVNFGQRPFAYTPPTGFVALNTFNLPTSTIVKGNTVMDATLYTGTLLSNAITNAASFKPDLVWVKSRSAATSHKLTDSVRGVTKGLVSNTTAAETTDTQGLTAFGSAGFTVGTDTNYNNLAATYVGWQWQAGQGSSSSNTNGTITSTVSVNASAGFSVVTYTGTNVSGATIGHGLGVAPSLIIVKNRTSAEAWPFYHSSVGATKYLVLNTTAAEATSSTPWNNTAPTSTVFSLGNWNALNESGSNHVAYCWTPIAGFSAFGSYTGNGSADGTFVYTGFRPKFVMIKRTDSTSNWTILDSVREGYNVDNDPLYPNLSDAEGTTDLIDILSNGFKLRSTDASVNASGGTYIYACWAETPFRNSLAR